jgi:fructose-1,6-bisphosphatase/inositol monophosphatase family enzyme
MGEWTRIYHELGPRVAGIRRFGAASLDLAWVAAGRYDGFWESSLQPWDSAAGCLLVREAGGSFRTTRAVRCRSATKPSWPATMRSIPSCTSWWLARSRRCGAAPVQNLHIGSGLPGNSAL